MKRFCAFILIFASTISVLHSSAYAICGADIEANKSDAQVVQDTLNNPELSASAKKNLLEKERLLHELENNASLFALTRATEKIIAVTPIMQETKSLCAAATIQMILNYLGESYNSQTNIIASTGEGPTLQSVMDYLNSHQSHNTYIRKTFDSQDALNRIISVAYMVDNPIIYTLIASQNQVDEGRWPYRTGGHFTVLRGIRSDGLYSIGDPLYFKRWVGSATANNGLHNQPYENIQLVNERKGENFVGY